MARLLTNKKRSLVQSAVVRVEGRGDFISEFYKYVDLYFLMLHSKKIEYLKSKYLRRFCGWLTGCVYSSQRETLLETPTPTVTSKRIGEAGTGSPTASIVSRQKSFASLLPGFSREEAAAASVDSVGSCARVASNIFPGFISQKGSKDFLMVRITPIVSGPSSCRRATFLPRPIPCSPCKTDQ